MLQYIGINPLTGGQMLQGGAKLLSIGAPFTLKGPNNTPAHIVTVEIEGKDGLITRSGFIYDTNLAKGVEIGKTYLTRVEKSPGYKTGLLIMSANQSADRAMADDFDFPGITAEDIAAAQAAADKLGVKFASRGQVPVAGTRQIASNTPA